MAFQVRHNLRNVSRIEVSEHIRKELSCLRFHKFSFDQCSFTTGGLSKFQCLCGLNPGYLKLDHVPYGPTQLVAYLSNLKSYISLYEFNSCSFVLESETRALFVFGLQFVARGIRSHSRLK